MIRIPAREGLIKKSFHPEGAATMGARNPMLKVGLRNENHAHHLNHPTGFAVLTTRTLAILERITPIASFESYHGPDEPLVIYEAEPVKAPAKKSRCK